MSYTDLFKALGDEGYTGTLNDRIVTAMRQVEGLENAGYNTCINYALENEYALGSNSRNFQAWKNDMFTIAPILNAFAPANPTVAARATGTPFSAATTQAVSLTGLSLADGDTVLLHYAQTINGTANTIGIADAGWTILEQFTTADNYDTTHIVAYKTMSGTPDSSVTVNNLSTFQFMGYHVFKIQNWTGTVVSTSLGQINTNRFNPPNLTGISSNACVLFGGANGLSSANGYAIDPGTWGNWALNTAGSGPYFSIASGYYDGSVGSDENPDPVTSTTDSILDSCGSYVVAFNPA